MRFLSEEFLQAWADAERPNLGDASGTIAVKTEGGPDGKVAITIGLDGGVVVGAWPGARKGADVELTLAYDLAAGLFRGDDDPAVAFMRGTIKMSGDMSLWLEILPAWRARFLADQSSPVLDATEF